MKNYENMNKEIFIYNKLIIEASQMTLCKIWLLEQRMQALAHMYIICILNVCKWAYFSAIVIIYK